MNDFIRLRNSYSNLDDLNLFSLIHLKEAKRNRRSNQKENKIIEHLQIVFHLRQNNKLNLEEMVSLLGYLGANVYVNSYIVDLFRNNKELFGIITFKEELIERLKETEIEDLAVYALLDSCIECGYDFISRQLLLDLLNRATLSLDTFSLIIDYIHRFHIVDFESAIYSWLCQDYPIIIKFQLIDLLIELYSMEYLINDPFNKISFNPEEEPLIQNYIDNLQIKKHPLKQGITVLQSMFYGDFENSGKGNNGGLAIFLKTLGNELSKSENIAKMITLTLATTWSADHFLINHSSENHLVANVPVYINQEKATEFLKKENILKRTIHRFLDRCELKPDVFHVRFLDNASKAIANLSKEQSKKLVVTLTPDPHRTMADQNGKLEIGPFKEWLEKFNKVVIGDELIEMSDKIVGIGNYSVKKELERYFPQLLTETHRTKIQMISEGIQIDLSFMNKDERLLTDAELASLGLTKEFLEQPIILNVGRLNKLKAQDQLLKAWGNSELSDVYHLLIIGGDLNHPDTEEQQMINMITEYLKENPSLKEKFLHLEALSNYQIRKLEKRIRSEQKNYPQLYLCSSKKEEFGIAILEALSQQFLVLAPKKGGVKSYIKSGANGFLIDTSNWQSIADATIKKVFPLKNKKRIFEKIQIAGEQTVKENFSMTTIAEDFLTLYLSFDIRSESNED